MTRHLLSLAPLIPLALAAGCKPQQQGVALAAEPTPIKITTPVTKSGDPSATGGAAARRGPSTVPLSGAAAAHRRSTMSARISGVVEKVHVVEADVVRAGDVLVTLDARHQRLALRQAKAAIALAEVRVTTTRHEAERAERLLATKAIPERQRDLTVAELQAAEAALEQAKVAQAQAEAAIADAVVRAPYDGVVVVRHVHEGEYVTAMPPTPMITVEETGIIDVRVQVPSAVLAAVAPGHPVRVRFPAVGVDVAAAITRLVPTVDSRTRSALAIVELPAPDAAIKPGLFAEIDVLPAGAGAAPAQAPAAAEPGP